MVPTTVLRAAIVGITVSVLLAGTGVAGAVPAASPAGGSVASPAAHPADAVGSPTVAGADGVNAFDRIGAADENETDDEENDTEVDVELTVGPPPASNSSAPVTTAVTTAATSVSSCTDVTSSGVYTVGTDLVGTDPVCINVTASNVVLDGQGHTIDAAGGVGIRVDAGATLTNVTVRNLTVTNGEIGVVYGSTGDPVDGSAIVNVNASVNSDYGIKVAAARNLTVADSVVGGNDVYGLELDGYDGPVSNVTVLETTVSANDGEGIYVKDADDTVLKNVTATDNDDENVEVDDSLDVLLSDVTATGAADLDGIEFDDAPNATLVDVVASDNGDDLSDAGVDMDESPNSTFTNVVANRNTAEGMVIRFSDDVSVADSYVADNLVGIEVFESSGVDIADTTVVNNDDWAIRVETSDRLREPILLSQDATGGPYATAENVDIGTATVGFGPSRDFAIQGALSPPDPPQGLVGVNQYLVATNTSTEGFVDLRVTYDAADAGGVVESKLALYRHNGSRWFEIGGSSVDSGANTVSANVTSFSTIAPFGEALVGRRGGGDREHRSDQTDGEQYACEHPTGSHEESGDRPRDCDA